MSRYHIFLALLITFIWGTNFVFIKVALHELPPFLMAALRFILVAFPLAFFLPRPQVAWRYLMSYGVLIGFGQFGLLFWAMRADLSPGIASLVMQTQVFYTILLAALLFKEHIRPLQILALSICFMGLLLIGWHTDGQTTVTGLLVALVASFAWACSNLVVKQVGKIDILAFIVWSALFSIPPLLLMSAYFEGYGAWQQLRQASFSTWLVMFWQSYGNTILGYGLWSFLLHRYSASSVAPWSLLVPVFGMSASVVAFAEPFPWWKANAALLILGGLVLNVYVSWASAKSFQRVSSATKS